MSLFKQKKKRIKFPKQEINPVKEMNQINSRINFLMNKEERIGRKTSKHKDQLNNEVSLIKQEMDSIKQDIKTIRTSIEQAKSNFENAVKELNTRAKIEDLDHLRRMMQEYDPADFISYEEFQNIVEEKMNKLRSI